VRVSEASLRRMGVEPIEAKLIEKHLEIQALWEKQDLLRHDCEVLARVLVDLL